MDKWNGFRGSAKRLEDLDIPRIAATIGCGEDHLHAFMDVEAAGSGFDSQGRPKMLFEPHVFYRNLQGEKRARAVKAGLAYPLWKRDYPKGSYPRLLAAIEIDETAALKAASWGLGQILGENHKLVGYSTPQAMVRAFVDDEEAHLEAIVAFLKGKGLDKYLRAHNWAEVARGYNGAQYAKNGYHTKMRAAFAKWQGIRDTPWPPAAPPEHAKPIASAEADVPIDMKPTGTGAVTFAKRPIDAPEAPSSPPPSVKWWSKVVNSLLRREP